MKGWYLDVFDAIVRNGNDREKSIREIANRRAEEGETIEKLERRGGLQKMALPWSPQDFPAPPSQRI